MEHSKVEDQEEEEEFPPFGDSQSDYDTVSLLNTSVTGWTRELIYYFFL